MQYFLIAAAGLALIVVASLFSRRTGLAAPLLLVVLGIGGSYLPGVPDIVIDPELILAGILPPLLFGSAVRLPVMDLRRNLKTIVWLSIVMVIVSAVVVGVLIHLIWPQIPVGLGVALGAVVSPTDAVAATAVGKRLGLPHRLMTVLEGESLVNDASALVVLRTAVATVGAAFSFWDALGDFAWAVFAAIVVGFIVGRLAGWLRSHLADPVLVSATSFAIPFAAFFPAEEVHASGVLAVVVAGLTTGSHRTKTLSARSRQVENTNWATVSFVGESALFILMGLQMPSLIRSLEQDSITTVLLASALVFVLLIVLRAGGMLFPLLSERRKTGRSEVTRQRLDAFDERIQQFDAESSREQRRLDAMRRRLEQGRADVDFREAEPITRRGALVLSWAGMRGAITVAAAQTIPADMPHRSAVVLIAFIVATATLIVFGSTLPAVIRSMDFRRPTKEDKRAEVRSLLQSAVSTVVDDIGPLDEQVIDGEKVDPAIAKAVAGRFGPLMSGVQQTDHRHPDARETSVLLQRRYVEALREAVLDEQSIGAYRSEAFTSALALIDQMEARLDNLE